MSGEVWFHGTTKEASEVILKKGFTAGTYFGQHLEDALHMGGEYIFEVWFDETFFATSRAFPMNRNYWQWITPDPIGVDQIRSVYRLEPTMIFDNQECHFRIKRSHVKEDHDDMVVVCMPCLGRGQEEYYHPFVRWRDMGGEHPGGTGGLPITICKVCNGHGALTTDGSDIYEPKKPNPES